MTGPVDADLVVHHCTVSVLRRGGWSWGPAPRRLPDLVLAALPGLLAERFAAQLAGDEDVEITEPVRLDVRVPLAALLAGPVPGSAGALTPSYPVPGSTVVGRALPGTPAGAVPGPPPSAVPPDVPAGFPAPPGAGQPAAGPAGAGPAGAGAPRDLAGWLAGYAGDDLGRLLALLPDRTRRAYRAVLAEPGTGGPEPAEAGAPHGDVPDRPAAAVPGPVPGAPGSGTGPEPLAGDVEVASALPFLVVAALDRIGLLAGIGPVLAGAGLDADGLDGPLFAAALAYQVLGPAAQGWLRTPSDHADAAALAGLPGPVPAERLSDFARRAAPALPLLSGLVAVGLCRGHDPARPLLLAAAHPRHGGGLLLADPDGVFPIAWVDEPVELLPHWAASGRPAVLVGGARLGPGAALAPVAVPRLRALAGSGVPLVCDAPPTRGERQWRRLPGPRRLWAAGEPAVPPAGADLGMLTGQLDELVEVLAARRAVPLAGDGPGGSGAFGAGDPFGRTVALLAALGLGTLAWLLWRHREAPDPQLALSRLGDLGAVVRFGPDEVEVHLPLGRRYQDLRDHRLLGTVAGVPWLGGRPLTFGGG